MKQLAFTNYINCFRKQFIFQKGRYGKRVNRYYTADNDEQGLKNDKWAIMVFIHLGTQYGFSDTEMQRELGVRFGMYSVLKDTVVEVLKPNYEDRALHKRVHSKISLVKNAVWYTHRVRPQKQIT